MESQTHRHTKSQTPLVTLPTRRLSPARKTNTGKGARRLTCSVSQRQQTATLEPAVARQRVALVVVGRAEHDVRDKPLAVGRLAVVVQLNVAQQTDRTVSDDERRLVAAPQARLLHFRQLHVRSTPARSCLRAHTSTLKFHGSSFRSSQLPRDILADNIIGVTQRVARVSLR